MITRVSTLEMSHEEWLSERRKSIGGSDAGALLGLNPYCSPYALWAEKTGKYIPDDISDKESVRLGKDLEDYVASRWQQSTGKKLRRDNAFVYNSEHPYAHVLADRLVVGERAGFEAKTTSSWDVIKGITEGKVPESWYCQCVHGMMVTGLEKWYLGVLCFGVGFFKFEYIRNGAEITALAAAERAFWGNVTNNIPPSIDGTEATTEALQTIFAESAPGTSCDLEPVSDSIALIREVRAKKKELDFIENEAKSTIMEYMGEVERGVHPQASVSWKSSVSSTFDKEKFFKDHPEIDFTQYITEKPKRIFRISYKDTDKE